MGVHDDDDKPVTLLVYALYNSLLDIINHGNYDSTWLLCGVVFGWASM
jgi:hypothetical protein